MMYCTPTLTGKLVKGPLRSKGQGGNMEIQESENFEIWGPGNPEIWGPKNQKNKKSQNPNPFCPKCRQGLD